MYQEINTVNDVVRERYLYNSELVGKYGFPQLQPINADLTGVKAVPFNLAQKDKMPRDSVCHFFIDDARFERLWNNPEKYFGILENFRYVCAPDFSFYDGMPLALKIWQVYRSRALAWWLYVNGFEVIPTVGWGSHDSYDYCFDGLPEGGTVAISTTGCHGADGKKIFHAGYMEMLKRLHPDRVLVVGQTLDCIPADGAVRVSYLESFGQNIRRRVAGAGEGARLYG